MLSSSAAANSKKSILTSRARCLLAAKSRHDSAEERMSGCSYVPGSHDLLARGSSIIYYYDVMLVYISYAHIDLLAA